MAMSVREAYKRIRDLTKRYLPDLKLQKDREKHLESREIPPPKTGKNPFLDPAFRKRKGLKALPPFVAQEN